MNPYHHPPSLPHLHLNIISHLTLTSLNHLTLNPLLLRNSKLTHSLLKTHLSQKPPFLPHLNTQHHHPLNITLKLPLKTLLPKHLALSLKLSPHHQNLSFPPLNQNLSLLPLNLNPPSPLWKRQSPYLTSLYWKSSGHYLKTLKSVMIPL